MSIFTSFFDWLGRCGGGSFDSDDETTIGMPEDCCCDINPATGLKTLGCGGIDTAGNPYGTDLHVDHGSSMSTGFSDDDWSSESNWGD